RSESKPRLARRSVMMRWMRPNFTGPRSRSDSDDACADAAWQRWRLSGAEPFGSRRRQGRLEERQEAQNRVCPDRRIGTDAIPDGRQHADAVATAQVRDGAGCGVADAPFESREPSVVRRSVDVRRLDD